MGHTLGTELRGTTFSIANSGNVTANSLGISFQGPNTSVWANVSSAGPTVSPRGWSFSSPQTGASLINVNTAKLRVSATATQNPPGNVSGDSTISWNHKVYAGFTSGSSADLILNQSGITGPTGPFVTTTLTSSPGQSITVNLTKNDASSQFMWILIPSGYTLVSSPLFTVSNSESPFNLESTGTFTNSVNFPSLYKKYKSEQPQSATSVNVLFNLAKV
jgi:hypothetical protein